MSKKMWLLLALGILTGGLILWLYLVWVLKDVYQ